MGHLSSAQEATPFSQNEGGSKRGSWRSERIFSASKACACCGQEFRPWIKRDKETNKIISCCPELAWIKQDCCSISCAKKLRNPMSNHQVRLKMKARLREIKHKPIKRGGNGQLLPLAQLALLHALGEGWEAELAIPTKMRNLGIGFPTCYKVDLANQSMKLAIELDGGSHCSLERKAQDLKKTDFLVSQGWSVYRVSNQRALELYSTFKSVDTLLTSLTGS